MKDPGLGVHGWRLVAPALLSRLCARQQLLEKQRVCGEKRRETEEDFDVLPRRTYTSPLSLVIKSNCMDGPTAKERFFLITFDVSYMCSSNEAHKKENTRSTAAMRSHTNGTMQVINFLG